MDDKLKTAFECCIEMRCSECPLFTHGDCYEKVKTAVEAYIAELEERIAIMQESMETLEKRCNALEALEQRCKTLETLEKRNEPVTPVREVGSYSQIFRCRNCDTLMVFQKQKYCHECGQAVKWDEQ